MFRLMLVTFKGIVRDRVLHGVGALSLFFILIPSISSLSMRQVVELSTTLSLSFISLILLVLATLLGSTLLWKDMERRYTFSVLSLPIGRAAYLLGKYLTVSLFVFIVSGILTLAAVIVINVSSGMYPPDRPVSWSFIVLCILFDAMKSLILISFAFLFSTVSTSLFLPVFGTLAVYFAGNASQQVYEYITAGGGSQLPSIIKGAATVLYYFLPNFSSFNLKTYAIYGVQPNFQSLWYVTAYFIVYTAIILVCASIIFYRKEMN